MIFWFYVYSCNTCFTIFLLSLWNTYFNVFFLVHISILWREINHLFCFQTIGICWHHFDLLILSYQCRTGPVDLPSAAVLWLQSNCHWFLLMGALYQAYIWANQFQGDSMLRRKENSSRYMLPGTVQGWQRRGRLGDEDSREQWPVPDHVKPMSHWSQNFFSDDKMLIEKYITKPR